METEYSEIPSIAFENYSIQSVNGSDEIILTISYIDGDGDLGLNDGDTIPPFHESSIFYYNFFIEYYEELEGVFTQVPRDRFNPKDTVNFHYRFPVLTPETRTKAIKGTIQATIPFRPLYSNKVKYKMRIADRALNLSNYVESPVITR